MAVIVDHRDAALRAAHLKAPVDATEMPPGLANRFHRNLQFQRRRRPRRSRSARCARRERADGNSPDRVAAKFEMKLAGHVARGASA